MKLCPRAGSLSARSMSRSTGAMNLSATRAETCLQTLNTRSPKCDAAANR